MRDLVARCVLNRVIKSVGPCGRNFPGMLLKVDVAASSVLRERNMTPVLITGK